MDEISEKTNIEVKPKESLLDKVKSLFKPIKPSNNMPQATNNATDFILPRVVEIKGKYYVKVPDKYLRKANLDHEIVRLTYEADLREKQISITKEPGGTYEAKIRWLRDFMWSEMKLVSEVLYNFPDLQHRIQGVVKSLEEKYQGRRMILW